MTTMTQEQWLTQYIADAFAGVQLDDGLDIHAAASADDYGNPEEDRLSLTAERKDWQRVSGEALSRRPSAVTFLDAPGFRFYAPAIMTAVINHDDDNGMLLDLLDSFLSNLKITIHGKINFGRENVNFDDLFTKHQRAAIIRFLKYLAHHGGGWSDIAEAKRRLDEIQTRTDH